jgi:hypothetical protein
VILALIGSGPTIIGITTLSASGGHYYTNATGNFTASLTNVVSIFGYAEVGAGILFLLLGIYLIVAGLGSPDKVATKKGTGRKRR